MTEPATFRSFTDEESARELAAWLRDRSILAAVGDSPAFFDPTFARSILTQRWNVVLPPHQFADAEKLLSAYYELRLAQVPSDYYLFSFSNEELHNIFREPDNWGDLDKVLAAHLLRERGQAISAAEIASLANRRMEELAKPERMSHDTAPYWGYGLCLLSLVFSMTRYGIPLGVLAIFVGSLMARGTKTLPDGRIVPRYDALSRKSGGRIIVLGIGAILINFGMLIYASLAD